MGQHHALLSAEDELTIIGFADFSVDGLSECQRYMWLVGKGFCGVGRQ